MSVSPTFDGQTGPLAQDSGRQGIPELSVVLPCLNEAGTLPACIEQIRRVTQDHGIHAEIVVADNGSTDGSAALATSLGVRVESVPRPGYGSALMGGITAARGQYVIMGDADCSYDFGDIPKLLDALRQGSDLVMGNRFTGGIRQGAMPALHRYFGNPLLTFIGRLFFQAPCRDFQCGLRGFTKRAYERMHLCTTGMEFASEMVVKASLFGMKIAEVPTTLSPDGRGRPPHMRSWRDGWRNLRFFLMYSPRWLFLYPGLLLIALGLGVGACVLPGPRRIGGIVFDIHTLLYAVAAILVGFQAVLFAFFTKMFAISEGLMPEDQKLNRLFRFFTLETGLCFGALMLLAGIACSIYSVMVWNRHNFGPLDSSFVMRIVASAVVLIVLGVETVFSSFFLSILGMARK